jgi:hypothetical protein
MAAADQTPYVGPRPFGRDEKDLFFGRDRETRDLCSLVVAHPIVLLYAASGAGKSSLLNAGLIPLLEARGYEVLPSARVSGRIPDAIKTSEVNNVYAFNVLSSWAGPSVDPMDLVKADIASFLANRPHREDAAGEPVLRVVLLDQFEELFTFARERWQERAALIRQLAEALERDPLLPSCLSCDGNSSLDSRRLRRYCRRRCARAFHSTNWAPKRPRRQSRDHSRGPTERSSPRRVSGSWKNCGRSQ